MRTKTGLLLALMMGIAVLTAACGGDTLSTTTSQSGAGDTSVTQDPTATTLDDALVYTAVLKGDNEVPAVKTSSTGTLTLTIAPDGSSVQYVLTIKKLTNITVARLREGRPGSSAGIIVSLYDGPAKSGPFTGTLAEGSFTENDLGGPLEGKAMADLVDLLESGRVWVNVGNASHKGGAICGTLEPAASPSVPTTTPEVTTTQSQAGGGQSSGSDALADLLAQYRQTKDVSLDFALTATGGQSTTGKMWSQAGKRMKLETTMSNVDSVMIIDLTDNTMIMYQPSTKQGVKTKVDIPLQDPSSYAENLDVSEVQDLGTEKVDGENCRVVQYTSSTGTTDGAKVLVKMWLSERLGFPVKMVTTSADGSVTTIEYTNIKVGALSDSDFEVPADVQIVSTP